MLSIKKKIVIEAKVFKKLSSGLFFLIGKVITQPRLLLSENLCYSGNTWSTKSLNEKRSFHSINLHNHLYLVTRCGNI